MLAFCFSPGTRMSPRLLSTCLRIPLLCLLAALAACEPRQAVPAVKARPTATHNAVMLVKEQKLDKSYAIAVARYFPRPSQPTPALLSTAMFDCIENADTDAVARFFSRRLEVGMTDAEIASVRVFFLGRLGKKYGDLDWTRTVNDHVAGSARRLADSAKDLDIRGGRRGAAVLEILRCYTKPGHPGRA